MKKFLLLLAVFLAIPAAQAAPETTTAPPARYGQPLVFIERGVEFAIFPDGQFDFYYNPNRAYSVPPHYEAFSHNAGYNYRPFVQYDQYGAIIQIETVPIFYDYYGRIIQAGRIKIYYNSFGRVERIGNLILHYDPYRRYAGYSGYINARNRYYSFKPWHRHYRRPQLAIVYHKPYRMHYEPKRFRYAQYREYYQKQGNDYRRNYYRPGERIASNDGTRRRERRSSYNGQEFSQETRVRSNRTSRISTLANGRTQTRSRVARSDYNTGENRRWVQRSTSTNRDSGTRYERSRNTQTRSSIRRDRSPEVRETYSTRGRQSNRSVQPSSSTRVRTQSAPVSAPKPVSQRGSRSSRGRG